MDRPRHLTIQALPPDLRPRERLRAHGAGALSTAELLGIIIGSGTRSATAVDVAAALLARYGTLSRLLRASVYEIAGHRGMGQVKAIKVAATLELARRLLDPGPSRYIVRTAADAAAVIMPAMLGLDREHFRVIMLNTRHEILDIVEVSVGGLSSAPVHPREVFKEAIRASAAAVIVVHNHPSGSPEPSRDDVLITEQLHAAGRVVGIELLDHLIIGERSYTSLREARQGFP